MNKFSINFYLQKAKTGEDNNFILISVAWNSFRLRSTLKFQIATNLWDSKKQRAKASSKNPLIINEKLDKIRNTLKELYDTVEREQNRYPTVKEVKAILNQIVNNKPPKQQKVKKQKPLLEHFEEFLKDSINGSRLSNNGKRIGYATVTSYTTTKNHLTEFVKAKRLSLTFDDVNDVFFSNLTKYLSEKKLSNNSQGRMIKIIKTFMHYTFDKGLHSNLKFVKALKVFDEETTQIALNEAELDAIQNLSKLTPRLQRLRDLFLVQTFTGLRYSDLKNLKPENINYTERRITIYTIKTETSLAIPISTKLEAIFQKYNGNLPVISSQQYNDGLKELCQIAGINDMVQLTHYIGKNRIDSLKPKYSLVSSHTARRTYITLTLKRGILPESLMLITGHSSRESFDKYVKATLNEAIDEVRNVWE